MMKINLLLINKPSKMKTKNLKKKQKNYLLSNMSLKKKCFNTFLLIIFICIIF